MKDVKELPSPSTLNEGADKVFIRDFFAFCEEVILEKQYP